MPVAADQERPVQQGKLAHRLQHGEARHIKFAWSVHPAEEARPPDAEQFGRLRRVPVRPRQRLADQPRFQRQAARGFVAPGWSLDLTLGQMRKLGAVVLIVKGQDRLWALTPLGWDHCAGRVNAFAPPPERTADPEEQRQRHERLIAGSDEAAAACERLSPRERQVLILTAQGLMSPEIAQRIHLAPKSVDDIKRRMLATLNVARSPAAAVIAAKAGLL